MSVDVCVWVWAQVLGLTTGVQVENWVAAVVIQFGL